MWTLTPTEATAAITNLADLRLGITMTTLGEPGAPSPSTGQPWTPPLLRASSRSGVPVHQLAERRGRPAHRGSKVRRRCDQAHDQQRRGLPDLEPGCVFRLQPYDRLVPRMRLEWTATVDVVLDLPAGSAPVAARSACSGVRDLRLCVFAGPVRDVLEDESYDPQSRCLLPRQWHLAVRDRVSHVPFLYRERRGDVVYRRRQRVLHGSVDDQPHRGEFRHIQGHRDVPGAIDLRTYEVSRPNPVPASPSCSTGSSMCPTRRWSHLLRGMRPSVRKRSSLSRSRSRPPSRSAEERDMRHRLNIQAEEGFSLAEILVTIVIVGSRSPPSWAVS